MTTGQATLDNGVKHRGAARRTGRDQRLGSALVENDLVDPGSLAAGAKAIEEAAVGPGQVEVKLHRGDCVVEQETSVGHWARESAGRVPRPLCGTRCAL